MGQIVKVSCEKCGKSKELCIGGGLSDCDFDVVISGLSEAQKEKMTEAKSLGAKRFSVSRIPCVCQVCGQFYAASMVNCIFEGKKRTVWSKCPACVSSKRSTISMENDTTCPVCGEAIIACYTGLWD
jgi:hypothetical protein